ncbi:MAG: hypothetical protein IKV97_05125 [Clostridia bacterium]|nr:hypothetical protein [Clostridia bacterium]
MLKNTATFILAFLLAALFIGYAFCITTLHHDSIEMFFSFQEDGNFVFMGKAYTPPRELTELIHGYARACEKMNGIFIADFISYLPKKSAAAIFAAVYDALSAIHMGAKDLIFGNM